MLSTSSCKRLLLLLWQMRTVSPATVYSVQSISFGM